MMKVFQDMEVDGDIEATSFVKDGGTSSQFLKADGSVDSTSYGTAYVHPDYAATNIDTSGATIVDIITTNATGHVTNLGTRTLTLANLGYTGATDANNYVLPTNLAGDDIDIDTTVLTGATVISDLDINITTDTSGRVTDANGTVATRTLTLANLGFTGDTDANNTTARTDEEIRDVAAAQWINGTNTTVVVDDAANTIKINATGASGIDGSGTASFLPKFSDTDTVTSSNIFENGSGDILINSSTIGDGALNVYQTTTDPSIHIVTNDAGASAGPIIKMERDSSSPADDDLLGKIEFVGNDSNGDGTTYGQLQGYIIDTTTGVNLRGGFKLESKQNTTMYTNLETLGTRGYLHNSWYIQDSLLITDTADVDFDDGSILKFNSSAGTAGQVLSSNGASSTPTWIDTVHSNTSEGGTGSVNIGNMVKITESAYIALGSKDADTLYVIVG